MPETQRQLVDLVFDGNVVPGASEITIIGSGPIPNGERWQIRKFGGSEVGTGDGVASVIALQKNNSSGWKTIRGFGIVSNCCEIEIGRDFIGNGTRKLRIIWQNKSSASKQIIAWVMGVRIPTYTGKIWKLMLFVTWN